MLLSQKEDFFCKFFPYHTHYTRTDGSHSDKQFVSLNSFSRCGFDSFCLVGVSDLDICEFIDNYPLAKRGLRSLSLKRSTITDAGLEASTMETLMIGDVI